MSNTFFAWNGNSTQVDNKTFELRKKIESCSKSRVGQRKYPKELKNEILDYVKASQLSEKQTADNLNIPATTIRDWQDFRKGKVRVRKVNHGAKGTRYSISTKIQVAIAVLEYGKTRKEVANSFEVALPTVSKWVDDYQEGLYNLDNVTQISRKKFDSFDIIIGEVRKLEAELDKKRIEAKEALEREHKEKLESLGL